MFVERKIRHSALFTNLVGWYAGAVSFPLSDVILVQLACTLSDVVFWLNSRITNLSLQSLIWYAPVISLFKWDAYDLDPPCSLLILGWSKCFPLITHFRKSGTILSGTRSISTMTISIMTFTVRSKTRDSITIPDIALPSWVLFILSVVFYWYSDWHFSECQNSE